MGVLATHTASIIPPDKPVVESRRREFERHARASDNNNLRLLFGSFRGGPLFPIQKCVGTVGESSSISFMALVYTTTALAPPYNARSYYPLLGLAHRSAARRVSPSLVDRPLPPVAERPACGGPRTQLSGRPSCRQPC
jgi:hypothetical protein